MGDPVMQHLSIEAGNTCPCTFWKGCQMLECIWSLTHFLLTFFFFFFLTYIRFLPPLTWHSLSVEGISLSSAFICVHTHTCRQQQFLCPRVITPPLNPHISPSAEWNCYSRSLLSHTAVVSASFFQDSALTHYYSCHFCCFIMSHSHAYLSVLYYPYISQSFTSLPPLSSDLFILDYKP